MRNAKLAIVAIAALALGAASSHATDFTRLDVQVIVNQDARNWGIDADNSRLDIEFLRLPRTGAAIGKVCGPIRSLRRAPSPHAFQSYAATLWLENGKLRVGSMTAFFMDIDELAATDTCR